MTKTFIQILTYMLIIVPRALAADPFIVTNVHVDATDSSTLAAQERAHKDGQLIATKILINRLTLYQARVEANIPDPVLTDAEQLIRALIINNEKRSGRHYFGDITVAFNPTAVRNYLQKYGLQMISTQARTRLFIPLLYGHDLWSENPWQAVWSQMQYDHALTPITSLKPEINGNAIITTEQAWNFDIPALRRIAQRYNTDQILIALTAQTRTGPRVHLVDIALDSQSWRDIGFFEAQDFAQLPFQIIDRLENDWKQATLITAETSQKIIVSVLYRDHLEWQILQNVINDSAQIHDARLDGLSKDGALMTLTYGGNLARLRTELAFKGVEIRNHPQLGVILLKSGQF